MKSPENCDDREVSLSNWAGPMKIDADRLKAELEKYGRVVRDELPVEQRPEWQVSPEILLRRFN